MMSDDYTVYDQMAALHIGVRMIFSVVGKLWTPRTKVSQWSPEMEPRLQEIFKIMH